MGRLEVLERIVKMRNETIEVLEQEVARLREEQDRLLPKDLGESLGLEQAGETIAWLRADIARLQERKRDLTVEVARLRELLRKTLEYDLAPRHREAISRALAPPSQTPSSSNSPETPPIL